MKIETNEYVYDIAINVAQIEITGRCNMNCIHCRDKGAANNDMPLWAIRKIIDFAVQNAENNFVEIVLSGGEPLLHPDFEEILKYCVQKKVSIEITTNGSMITSRYIEMLKKYSITNVSVSLDSAIEEKHDYIRQYRGAFKKAISAINLMVKNGINARIRATISKRNIHELKDLAELAVKLGVHCLAVGPVMPIGNAVNLSDEFFSTKDEMRSFIQAFYELKSEYKNRLDVITNECLHCLWESETDEVEENNILVLNGCTAGIVTFNVLLNGDITPCSMFHLPIANIYKDSNLEEKYVNSELIKKLLDREYKGKCGICKKKYECGGCRARAKYFLNDYLENDPLCWI